MNEIIEIANPMTATRAPVGDIILMPERRGRPIGSRNSVSIEEHNQRQISRKKNLQVNFQKYKEQHHEELKKIYIEHYHNNKEKKLKRMKDLYGMKAHIKNLMSLDVSIMV